MKSFFKDSARLLLMIVVFAMGCRSADSDDTNAALSVSMVNLIENVHNYGGKRVHVGGYLGVDMNLYLSKEHANAFDMKSSIPISDTDRGDIESSPCVRSFVFIEGRLAETDTDLYTLVDVSSVIQPGREGQVCLHRE